MSFGGGTTFGSFTAKTFTLAPTAVGDIILVQVICETAADYASARCLYQRAIALGMGGGDAQVRQLGWPASARSLFLCMLSLTRSRPRAEDPPPEHSS